MSGRPERPGSLFLSGAWLRWRIIVGRLTIGATSRTRISTTGVASRALTMSIADASAMGLPASAVLTVAGLRPDFWARSVPLNPRMAISYASRAGSKAMLTSSLPAELRRRGCRSACRP